MDYKERGSIRITWSLMGHQHAVLTDAQTEEHVVNLRCPGQGPSGIDEDLNSRNFNGEALVPAATWQEFLTECKKNNRQTQIIRGVPNELGSDTEWYYVRDGQETKLVKPNSV
jgi:hypothetical protein